MGKNAVGGGAHIRRRNQSFPRFSDPALWEAAGICEPDAGHSREHHYCRSIHRLYVPNRLGHLERLPPTRNQARPRFLIQLEAVVLIARVEVKSRGGATV